MKSFLILFWVGLSLLGLISCSSPYYKIQLRDGREITAHSAPEFQAKTGYYRYRNDRGKDALLLREEVLLIEQM
jgi:hypothetical protein